MENKPLTLITAITGLLCLGYGFYLLFQTEGLTSTNSISKPLIHKRITVPSTVMWYDTGIDIPLGRQYEIVYYSGKWTNLKGTDATDGLGKYSDNRKSLIVPGGYLSQLAGKVGKDIFIVGNNRVAEAPEAGRLYLSMNDVPKTFHDNEGALDVLVEVK